MAILAALALHDRAAAERWIELAEKFDEVRGSALATVIRQRRAELLEKDDRDAAAAELPRVLPYWRRVKAARYLEELRRWAEARGLPFPE